MYSIIKQVVEGKNFELKSTLKKINKLWAEDELTAEQREELVELARKNAVAENSYASIQKQIDTLFQNLSEIAQTVNTVLGYLEKFGITIKPEETEEYPEYVQPTGAHDAYKSGDKITYNGEKYECVMDNCVWTPSDYPQGWKLVEAEEIKTE